MERQREMEMEEIKEPLISYFPPEEETALIVQSPLEIGTPQQPYVPYLLPEETASIVQSPLEIGTPQQPYVPYLPPEETASIVQPPLEIGTPQQPYAPVGGEAGAETVSPLAGVPFFLSLEEAEQRLQGAPAGAEALPSLASEKRPERPRTEAAATKAKATQRRVAGASTAKARWRRGAAGEIGAIPREGYGRRPVGGALPQSPPFVSLGAAAAMVPRSVMEVPPASLEQKFQTGRVPIVASAEEVQRAENSALELAPTETPIVSAQKLGAAYYGNWSMMCDITLTTYPLKRQEAASQYSPLLPKADDIMLDIPPVHIDIPWRYGKWWTTVTHRGTEQLQVPMPNQLETWYKELYGTLLATSSSRYVDWLGANGLFIKSQCFVLKFAFRVGDTLGSSIVNFFEYMLFAAQQPDVQWTKVRVIHAIMDFYAKPFSKREAAEIKGIVQGSALYENNLEQARARATSEQVDEQQIATYALSRCFDTVIDGMKGEEVLSRLYSNRMPRWYFCAAFGDEDAKLGKGNITLKRFNGQLTFNTKKLEMVRMPGQPSTYSRLEYMINVVWESNIFAILEIPAVRRLAPPRK
jgi:hypothetical protein